MAMQILSWIAIFWGEIFKFWENQYLKKLIYKIFHEHFGIFRQKRMICERTLVDECTYKISKWYLQTSCLSLFWMPSKGHFYAIYENCGNFPMFKFSPIWAGAKVYYGHLLCYWRNSNLETCITVPKSKIFNLPFTSWPWMTLTWHKTTKELEDSLKYLRHDPCRSIDLFQSDTAVLSGEASNDRLSIIWNLTRPVTSSVTFRQNFATF